MDNGTNLSTNCCFFVVIRSIKSNIFSLISSICSACVLILTSVVDATGISIILAKNILFKNIFKNIYSCKPDASDLI
jgi:hypothetical protein